MRYCRTICSSSTHQERSHMAKVIHIRTMSYHILKIISVIFAYCSVSIVLVFANKYLVGNQNSETDVSLFVLWVQSLVTIVLMTCINLSKAAWANNWAKMRINQQQLFAFPVLRMNCTFVCMLAFNNMCLRYVDIAFYQVARSLTIIFVVVFSVTILKKLVSWKVVICCIIIAGGFFLGIDQEQLLGTLSIKGVVYGILSSLFVALNGIFTKQALDSVDKDPYKLTFYGNLNASMLFIPIVFATGQFSEAYKAIPTWDGTYWSFLITTGILCFFIAWIGSIQINLTSPLTHTIIANSKSIVQTVIAVLYYHEVKSLLWWTSIVLVVGGACAYTIIKIREEERAKKTNESLLKSPVNSDLNQVEKGQVESLLNGTVPKTTNGDCTELRA